MRLARKMSRNAKEEYVTTVALDSKRGTHEDRARVHALASKLWVTERGWPRQKLWSLWSPIRPRVFETLVVSWRALAVGSACVDGVLAGAIAPHCHRVRVVYSRCRHRRVFSLAGSTPLAR